MCYFHVDNLSWDHLAFLQGVEQPAPSAFILTALCLYLAVGIKGVESSEDDPTDFLRGRRRFFFWFNSDRCGLR